MRPAMRELRKRPCKRPTRCATLKKGASDRRTLYPALRASQEVVFKLLASAYWSWLLGYHHRER